MEDNPRLQELISYLDKQRLINSRTDKHVPWKKVLNIAKYERDHASIGLQVGLYSFLGGMIGVFGSPDGSTIQNMGLALALFGGFTFGQNMIKYINRNECVYEVRQVLADK